MTRRSTAANLGEEDPHKKVPGSLTKASLGVIGQLMWFGQPVVVDVFRVIMEPVPLEEEHVMAHSKGEFSHQVVSQRV